MLPTQGAFSNYLMTSYYSGVQLLFRSLEKEGTVKFRERQMFLDQKQFKVMKLD